MYNTTCAPLTDRTARLLILLLALTFLRAPAALAQTPGSDGSGMLVEIPIPLTIITGADRTRLVLRGRIDDSMQIVAIAAEPVLEALAETVIPSIQEGLAADGDGGWLSMEDIARHGMSLVFDRHKLSAELRVPVTALGTQTLSLQQPRRLPGYASVESADVALALPVWTQYRSSTITGSDTISALFLRTSPGLSVYQWVLESDLRLNWPNLEESTEPDGIVENTRVIRFWDDEGYRLQLGQFVQYTRGLQAPMQLLGASFDNLEADTRRSLYPALLDRPLTVDQAGTISVFLNERRIRSFPVAPGQYELRDLPLSSGINTARVEYARADGEVETYDLIIPHAGGLLNPGRISYALALGVEEDELDLPAGSGFVRYGVGETLTAGVLLDGSTRGGQIGGELVSATRFGEPLVAGYVSVDSELDPGWAAQAGYRFILPGRTRLPLVATTIEYRDQNYTRPGSTAAGSAQAWQISSSLSQTLPAEINLSAGHLFRTFHGDSARNSILFASLSRNLGPRLGLRVTGTVDTTDPEEQWGLRITVSTRSVQRSLGGTATLDARNATLDMSGNATRSGPVTLSTGARINTIDLETGTVGGVAGSLRVGGSRFELSGSGGAGFTDADRVTDQELRSTNYTAQFGTGIYVADRVVGLGIPTRSSFALVRPARDLPARTVAVRTGGGAAPRLSGSMGPAFLPNLAPGSRTPITVDVPDLPADFSLGRTQFILETGYRTGTAITIESLPRLYVRGRVLDARGEGLVYKGMVVTPLFEITEDLEDPPLGGASFTDERGMFEVYGLVPGEYSLILRDGTDRRATFTVPAEPGPLVILDDIQLQGGSR